MRPRRTRSTILLGVAAALALVSGATAQAQDTTAAASARASQDTINAESDYRARRQAQLNEIRDAQRKLAELRSQRLALESRVESAAVKITTGRASALLLSHETTALRQLDSVLTISQDNLLAQRDRFLSLGEAVRRRADAELVVVIRVDSTSQPQHVDSLNVQVDSAPAAARRYSESANAALAAGAVDEVYHSNVLPSTHAVTLTAKFNGGSLTKSVAVDVPIGAVTYVQFAIRDGQLLLSTWTNRSGSP